jgi:hypothetical protein
MSLISIFTSKCPLKLPNNFQCSLPYDEHTLIEIKIKYSNHFFKKKKKKKNKSDVSHHTTKLEYL